MAPIVKSPGVTPTEQLLAKWCDRAFLKLWSYPNPCKEDGDEICDLLVVFEDHVFLFFDRESREFDSAHKDFLVSWGRWKKKTIDKQIKTAKGAERYIRDGRPIFLDPKMATRFPIAIPKGAKIKKFVVAHGAEEACKAFSEDNVSGSLAIVYGLPLSGDRFPFLIGLDKEDIVHVLDSHNLGILFETLDTFYDFSAYIEEKERAIAKYDALIYCGEEDLIAHYFRTYNPKQKEYHIGPKNEEDLYINITEGEWKSFVDQGHFERRKQANKISYEWDELIQIVSDNALAGTLVEDGDHLRKSEIILREMAKEPRVHRRGFSKKIREDVKKFPETAMHNMTFMCSLSGEVGYIFLQLRCATDMDYENEYRPVRKYKLGVACGTMRNRFPHLKKVVGIGIDTPKYPGSSSKDFLLLECEEWSTEESEYYLQANKELGFFESENLNWREERVTDFPGED